jgi:hypothetical protein
VGILTVLVHLNALAVVALVREKTVALKTVVNADESDVDVQTHAGF